MSHMTTIKARKQNILTASNWQGMPAFGLVPIFVNFTELTENTEKSSFFSVFSVIKFFKKE